MKQTGAQIVVETLIEQGCHTVFGYPGGTVLDIYDALYENSHRINHIITAHEQGATHAADGYARATGTVGVVIATSGPGATNIVTGIANAYLDSIPLVAITGNVSTDLIGKDSFQEVDIAGITMPITKHNYRVRDITTLKETLEEAFTIAKSGRPGPVLVDIPKDVQKQVLSNTSIKSVYEYEYPIPEEAQIAEAIALIGKSERPFIYAGGGVLTAEVSQEVMELAKRIDAPIGLSMMGLSAIPHSNPYNLGMVGMHGEYAASKAKSEADLIIAMGVRFSDRATGNKAEYGKKAKIIHLDIDPAEIDKNIPVYLGLVGNMKTLLKRLLEEIEQKKCEAWQKEIKEYKGIYAPPKGEESTLTGRSIIQRVNAYCNQDTIIATDVGQHQMWTAQYYHFEKTRRFITSGGLGTMGFGMGAAIGACIGNHKKRTVLITGDGSFAMNLNEMVTAVSNELPIIVVIVNNGVLGMVRQWQSLFYGKRYSNTTLERKTNFVKLAEAFGAEGYKATNQIELNQALAQAIYSSGPVVIDCHISPEEKVIPMIPPGASIHEIILK